MYERSTPSRSVTSGLAIGTSVAVAFAFTLLLAMPGVVSADPQGEPVLNTNGAAAPATDNEEPLPAKELSEEELAAEQAQRQPVPAADHDFDTHDKDADLKLSADELTPTGYAMDAVDADGDGFATRVEYRDYVTEQRITATLDSMRDVVACLRTMYLRDSKFPSELKALVDEGLQSDVSRDAWGMPYRFTTAGDRSGANSVDGRKALEERIRRIAAEMAVQQGRSRLSLISAGADGEFGTDDDIARTDSAVRSYITESRRLSLRRADQERVQETESLWARELATCLWLALAEDELFTGMRRKSLDGLKLPAAFFPSGQPVDAFGRTFRLVEARGLRAIRAEALPDKAEAVVVTENAFVTRAIARAGIDLGKGAAGRSRQYNYMDELAQVCMSFLDTYGRLPETMPELISFGGNNSWVFRSGQIEQYRYLTFNNGRNYALIWLGYDAAPGGTGSDTDTYGYSEQFDSRAIVRNHVDFDSAQTARYASFNAALQARAAELRMVREPWNDEFRSNTLSLMPDAHRERLRALVGERVAAAEAAEKEAEESKASEKKADDASDKDGVNNIVELRAQEAPPNNPVAAPVAGGGDKGAGAAEKEEKAEGEEPAASGEPAALEPDKPQAFKLTSRNMIPARLFTRTEADTLKLFSAGLEYEIYYYSNQLQALRNSLRNAVNGLTPAELPFGNVDLPANARFRAMVGSPWWEEYSWKEEEAFQAFVVARLEVENSNLRQLVCVAVPKENSSMPIVVSPIINGEYMDFFYARVSDQPAGWVEAMVKCYRNPDLAEPDANPEEKPAGETPAEDKPDQDVPEGEKPAGEKPAEAKPAGE